RCRERSASRHLHLPMQSRSDLPFLTSPLRAALIVAQSAALMQVAVHSVLPVQAAELLLALPDVVERLRQDTSLSAAWLQTSPPQPPKNAPPTRRSSEAAKPIFNFIVRIS